MKKKKSHSKGFNISAVLITLILFFNLIITVLMYIRYKNQQIDLTIAINVILIVDVVLIGIAVAMFGLYYKYLHSKVLIPVERVKQELNRLTRGDLEAPIEIAVIPEMQDIYSDLEEIRKKLEVFSAQQKEKREIRRTYVSGLMHDIATPVTRISGCASMICDGMVSSEQDIRKFAEMIVQNTEDINIMLGNLAEIEKYERTEILGNLLPIDMGHIIGYYVNGLKLELASKNTEITFINRCKKTPVCRIDVKSCKRVLMNLINNSVKYGKPGEKCEIVIALEIDKPDTLLFSLSDNGIGIEDGNEEKIFDLFYRADSSRHNPDTGNGIGLYVSKQIINANNAEIWAENNGNGLTVFAAFPLVDEEPVDWFEL